MENKFRVKREMYDLLGDYCEQLNQRIDSLQEELDNALAKDIKERDYCEEVKVIEYPDKIRAVKQIISHMEKLL